MNDNENVLSNAMKITVGKQYEVVGQDIYGAGKSHIVEVIARNGDEIIVKTDTGLVGSGEVDEDEDAEVTLENKNHYFFTGTFGVENDRGSSATRY